MVPSLRMGSVAACLQHFGCCLALLLTLTGAARARNESPPAPTAQIEKEYRRAPGLNRLYELGRSARDEGRALAAIDLLLRYLDEAGDQADPQRRAEITALLA